MPDLRPHAACPLCQKWVPLTPRNRLIGTHASPNVRMSLGMRGRAAGPGRTCRGAGQPPTTATTAQEDTRDQR